MGGGSLMVGTVFEFVDDAVLKSGILSVYVHQGAFDASSDSEV